VDDDLSLLLRESWLRENARDKCVFNIERNGCQLTVCVRRRPLFCTSERQHGLDRCMLKDKHKEVPSNKGLVHGYLGQTFDYRREGECKIGMLGYTREFLEE
jgi:hypothetical protein